MRQLANAMYRRLWLAVILFLLVVPGARAENSAGGVLFFPDQAARPENDVFDVEAGQEVEVCIRINPKFHPLLNRLVSESTGFRLVLEDNKTPPNAIMVQEESKKGVLPPGADGCYSSRFKIPPLTEEGIYQVADLLFKVPGRGYLSIHQLLYDFSQADELNVKNPKSDEEKPSLVEISTLQEKTRRLGKYYDFFKIEVKQDFTFNETGSGLEPKSLKVWYQLLENGERTGIYLAQCRPAFRKKQTFHCDLQLTRPQYQWDLSQLSLQLDSLSVEDKAGNRLYLQGAEEFKKVSPSTPIQFNFSEEEPGVPRHNPHINRMRP